MAVNIRVKSRRSDIDFKGGAERIMMDAASRGFVTSQDKLVSNGTSDTGELLTSGVPPRREADGSIVWGYNAPHAVWIEYGRAPGYVSPEHLKGWARRKLGDEGAAYPVAKKISKEGFEPQPFVRPGRGAMMHHLRQNGITLRDVKVRTVSRGSI